jgi:NO-binding membrane sensor protein with MHYT domain
MLPHDPSLVILSATIAILGAFTACVLTSNLLYVSQGEARLRVVMASAALGSTLWATQFVGLLAINTPVNWNLRPEFIAASGLAALLGSAGALILAGLGRAANRFPIAVAIFGLGVTATNYFGLAAATAGTLMISWFLAAMAIAICFQVAGLSLWFMLKRRGLVVTLLGALVCGLALSATHYVTAASTPHLEETLLALPPDVMGLSERYLAWSTTIIMYLICSICLCVFVVMQFREEIR